MAKSVKKCQKVVVESVIPFSEKQQDALQQKLKEVLKTSNVQTRFVLNPDLLGGIRIKINAELLDLSVIGKLQQFKTQLEESKKDVGEVKLETFLSEHIQNFKPTYQIHEVGHVLSVSDGIVCVSGLGHVMSGELIRFESGASGMALNLNADTIDVVVFDQAESIREGMNAAAVGHMNTIPVGLSLLGRVVDPLGKPLDHKESLDRAEERPIFAAAPGIIERDKVCHPVHTGIKAIDALVPIGEGQRELIIGDRQTGKTTLIIDTIISQKKRNEQAKSFKDKLFCIYVAIGQKQSTVLDVMKTLKKHGATDYTIIVSATASDTAAMQYLAPYAGCTLGEYFRDQGMNAIVFYDDLSKHAVAYREMSLLLKRPAGREAYPGDVFYLHSRLLERAAQLSDKCGGGSLTAIPVIETQEGDVSAYIPTNVISITDGQIFLDNQLFNQGVRPAINVGLSVSRVGSSAQSSAMKKVAGSLKLDLSQYREVLNFAQLSSDLDSATQQVLKRGAKLTEVMKQRPYHPLSLAEEVVSLFVANQGYLDQMPEDEIDKKLKQVTAELNLQYVEIMTALEKGQMTPETEQKLKEACQRFFEVKEN